MRLLSVTLVFTFFLGTVLNAPVEESPPSCSSKVYCNGDMLHDVQMAHLFNDSKTFVDMKLKFSASEVLNNYAKLKAEYKGQAPPKNVLTTFVSDNFENGGDLVMTDPSDWVENPSILNKIKDPAYVEWASALNHVWKNLTRKMPDDVKLNQDRYSLIYVPNSFVIPGGRFRELYYWDTYWIINGLLQCDMLSTVKGVIENLLSLVKLLGHVPNGSRVYYEQRSQPPMLPLMVKSYLDATNDIRFLHDNIDFLDEEMNYWLENRMVKVPFKGKTYEMFHYYAISSGPRPESYREDVITAANKTTDEERNAMYIDLKSAAESGWDFSTRWFISNGTNQGNLSDIATRDIIPVDLNALLQRDFCLLSTWYAEMGDAQKSRKYGRLSNNLKRAINTVLWDEKAGIWFDYDIQNNKRREYFYLSNFSPLWTESYSIKKEALTSRVLHYVEENKLEQYIGGSPTSLEFSGEQWDFPNAWAPLQAFVIQGLDRIGTKQASETAYSLASKWLHSNYQGYHNFRKMFEKYDALLVGETGNGGEYNSQEGFGWTNGVVFEFLARWGTQLNAYEDKNRPPAS